MPSCLISEIYNSADTDYNILAYIWASFERTSGSKFHANLATLYSTDLTTRHRHSRSIYF